MNANKTYSHGIKLRPINIQDYEAVLKWSKDPSFCSANGWEQNQPSERLYTWWSNCVNNAEKDFFRKGKELNGELIGYADLASIKDHTAELGIAVGESRLWGKGIGYHSALCMLKYGAEKVGISTFLVDA
ncbi:GNAT family N-acetyltransferase [Jeotgalibacillus sp. ET6]|uniref:GNAT family N-acetyltransferase n=1 Tax=Jeotgalibacillus sp. ET6 TaxID=3037260 RepID=UPI002418AFC8|nr:GNAT family N-acetyltransferase [Jeotgalibacillus sp. ET6]MDG5472480.1 GNAT family N-acetyltransferase [Jeotgalibacillus sp. ET6]